MKDLIIIIFIIRKGVHLYISFDRVPSAFFKNLNRIINLRSSRGSVIILFYKGKRVKECSQKSYYFILFFIMTNNLLIKNLKY